ncbi:MAG: vitamin K epoxide reductase family protein [Deltaproteobacteria bacterium]|nr:vitamin K epoxide reductase family protein [Deltaproteobacteria bacterium]
MALAGMALTGYLTATAWAGQTVAGCAAGSGCDLVLASRWSKLFGLPVSFWGFLAYASLAGIAWIRRADRHWRLAALVSLFGALYSLYLTLMAFMLAIFVTVIYQRPRNPSRFSWGSWLLWAGAGGVAVVIALHLHYAGVWGKTAAPEEPKVRALAEHLAKSNAKFYGAYWCPHCEDQKLMFGASANRLPYIECSPQGARGPLAKICSDARIERFPTWIIGGDRREGVLTLTELARYSAFPGGFP